jgi:hypothetical protein
MTKRTLLDMVQGILNTMDSDEVNSISDTIESTQVAKIIKDIYFEIIDDKELPCNNTLFSLLASGDTSKPTHMTLPDNVSKIYWIKYDVRLDNADARDYAIIHYMKPEDFIDFVNARDGSDVTQYQSVAMDANIDIIIKKDSAPQFYTSFDDETFVFDAYNDAVDSTLQTNKSLCYGTERPTFSLTDNFTADLPENLFNLLYNSAMNRCHAVVKQQLNPMIDRLEKRTRVRSQRNKWREDMKYDWTDFGRKRY